jgi:hypothetical protein
VVAVGDRHERYYREPNSFIYHWRMSPKKETPHTPKGGYAKAVLDSIVALKERNGSSPQAIIKYVKAHKPQLPEDKLKLQVKLALRRLLKQKLIEKVFHSSVT